MVIIMAMAMDMVTVTDILTAMGITEATIMITIRTKEAMKIHC